MSRKIDVVRALKDAAYRESLGAEERALVPPSQAGHIELDDTELESVVGGLFLASSDSNRSATVTNGSGGTCHCSCPRLQARTTL
jgi:mersacidin/lichenicidin family type 2 lantibiotic